jgi:23S rRNA pseudouridine955/2504/2580 synthase
VEISAADAKRIQSYVIYKDEQFLAINKPTGMATQGGTGVRDHVDKYLEALKYDMPEKPRLVHRLDKVNRFSK